MMVVVVVHHEWKQQNEHFEGCEAISKPTFSCITAVRGLSAGRDMMRAGGQRREEEALHNTATSYQLLHTHALIGAHKIGVN